MNSTPNDGIFDRDNHAFQLFQNSKNKFSEKNLAL